MDQIRVLRKSGLPVDLSFLEDYKNDFREMYDKVSAKVDKLIKKDMERFKHKHGLYFTQRLLGYGEFLLKKKYNQEPTMVSFPKSPEDWYVLKDRFGHQLDVVQLNSGENVILIIDLN